MKGTIKLLLLFGWLILSGCGLLKSKCEVCEGTGKVGCISCNSTGKRDDTWCYGTGKQTCTDCNGAGKKNVYLPQETQNGYQYATYLGQTEYGWVWGEHYADFPCNKCSKTGKIECSNMSCDNGKVDCNMCYGKGEQTCSACNGEGNK